MKCYLLAFDADARVVDGPWGYELGPEAETAAANYRARVAAEDGMRALVIEAESLDELIAAHPDIFARSDEAVPLRGLRLLTRVDRRARMFTPFGLAPGAPMSDEDALVLVQQRLRVLRLPTGAHPAVRDQVKSLCDLAIYGCFAYDFNHVVVTMAALAHEIALGAKFVEVHGGRVPLVNAKSGEEATLELGLLGQLAEAMEPAGHYPHVRGWRLRDHPSFRPSLAGLVRWAHGRGLFSAWLDQLWSRVRWSVSSIELTRGPEDKWTPPEYGTWPQAQRSQWWETVGRGRWERDYLGTIAGIRNAVAHPSMHSITSPVEASRAIAEFVAFVGRLWPEPVATSIEPDAPIEAASPAPDALA
jgi:hypothetical protein